MKTTTDRLNQEMFAPRKNYVRPLLVFAIAFIIALALFVVTSVGASASLVHDSSGAEFENPYYVVCFDPLLSNVVLTLPDCGKGAEAKGSDAAESASAVVIVDIPVDSPVVDVTVPVISTPVTPIVTPAPVITPSPIVEIPEVTTPEAPSDDCENGNPGNTKCVGNAGEDPNGRGTMPNDSTDGNGEHGNQGVGNPNK